MRNCILGAMAVLCCASATAAWAGGPEVDMPASGAACMASRGGVSEVRLSVPAEPDGQAQTLRCTRLLDTTQIRLPHHAARA